LEKEEWGSSNRQRYSHRYGWCEQAASYWETLAVLREFCGCWPAYLLPALPLGLNAEPGADAALPGVFGAVALPHDCLG
jgi:hypothetical protein